MTKKSIFIESNREYILLVILQIIVISKMRHLNSKYLIIHNLK